MLDTPFFAGAIATLPFVAAPSAACPTMGTDGVRIFYNPVWCAKQSSDDIDFVVTHELMHCLLGHMDRRQQRDFEIWNIAADYSVNGLLVQSGLAMPANGFYAGRFQGMTAEWIYDSLLAECSSWPGDYASYLESLGVPLDAHFEPDGPLSGLVAVPGAETPEERRRLRISLLDRAQSELPGTMRGFMQQEIEASRSNRIPWQQALAYFVSGLRQSDYRMYPFNKKHLWRCLFMPSLGVPGPKHLLVAIDTSGSMSERMISIVLGEISSLRASSECLITIVQCDTEVQSSACYEAYDEFPQFAKIVGRGGTDFRPVFEYVTSLDESIDAMIFLTDGFGPAPSDAPMYPVLWVLTPSGRCPAEWGMEVKLEDLHGAT